MAYRMWKKGRTNDYKFIDSAIAEQYNIGGVDMWLYAYVGPKQVANNTDLSYGGDYYGSDSTVVSSIGDLIFGDTPNRNYNLEAITLSCVYQVQEATPDLKIPGLFFNFNTMDITIHYNTMMQRLGRKIMPGDVIELPNLRDFDVLGKDSGLNRFYVVQDGFRTSEGYSVTWQHHIYKLRVKPLTDSPEYSDLLDNNNYPDDPDDPNNGNGNTNDGSSDNSSYGNEMDIMNRIIMQADDEVPYIHYTNEHLFDDRPDTVDLSKYMLNGYELPEEPANKMYFLKKTYPVLKELSNDTWISVEVKHGTVFPRKPMDGDFFFKENEADVTGFTLYQYDKSSKKWLNCDVEYTTGNTAPQGVEDFYIEYKEPHIYQYLNGKWGEPEVTYVNDPFTSNSVYGNIDSQQDYRPKIPPARGTVPEGDMFPSDAVDGDYYYRTDYTPVTLWEFSASKNSWVIFDYGGRKPWEGADLALTEFVNSPNRVPLHDAVKPNTVYRIHKDSE
jgi:hypothetical protein